jgi:hypothetical protein
LPIADKLKVMQQLPDGLARRFVQNNDSKYRRADVQKMNRNLAFLA